MTPENLVNIPLCQHIKDDGIRCGSPALRGKKLCYFHERQRKTFPHRRPYRTANFCRRADFFNVRTPDDVMVALSQVMNAVLRHQLSPREAGAIIFALQTASTFAPYTTAARAQSRSNHAAQATTLSSHFNHARPDDPILHPKSVAEIFEMFPGLDDLKAMLTPDDIARLDNRIALHSPTHAPCR